MSAHSFRTLAAIDVSRFVEKKGQFSYLSWPYAVAQLRLADPEATWAVMRFGGLPYLLTDLGYFVEVAVTVQGLTLSQIHPVLDAKNRPIAQPTTFDINTSIQRALVKAIALHGLGLNVYAGEDLPMDAEPQADGGDVTPPTERERAPEPVRPAPTKLTNLADRRESGRSEPSQPATYITANQRRYIERLIENTHTNIDALLEYFGLESLDEIPRSEASRVISALEQQRRAA